MQRILTILLVVVTFYIVEYEQYAWTPCKDDFCYAINCPVGGCVAAGKKLICTEKTCVEEILSKNGTEHLTGVWEVSLINDFAITQPPVMRKLDVEKTYRVK